jgi:hypothetical protein
MARGPGRIWLIVVLVVVLGAAAGLVLWRRPLLLPGSHTVEVYAVNDALSGPPDHQPRLLARLLGMCDTDSYYVRDGNTRLCLVLSGPLGEVKARRTGRTVTVAPADAASLKQMATTDTGSPEPTTRLALRANGRPVAIVAVADIAAGAPVSATALD